MHQTHEAAQARAPRPSIKHAEADIARRKLLGSLAVFGSLGLAACGGGEDSEDTTSAASATDSTDGNGSCSVIPSEVAGPYPGDGSNTNSGSTVDVLALAGIVRSDIRSSVGSATAKAGAPLVLTLKVVNANASCAALAGAAVYIWHCDKDGEYSAYTAGNNGAHFGESFLRGVQLTDANGEVRFTTIFPGWYAGRITHIHAEIYADGNFATGTPTRTTQFAFPAASVTEVYNTSLYTKGQNTSVASVSADNIFSDGSSQQTLSLAADGSGGYTANLTLPITA